MFHINLWPNQQYSSPSSSSQTSSNMNSETRERTRGHQHQSSTTSITAPTAKNVKLPPYLVDTSFGVWIADRERTRAEDAPPEVSLPTTWNCSDKNNLLEISNQGLRVAYTGPGKNDLDVAAVRANYSMPPQCGLFYFEVEIISKGREGLIGIGFCTKSVKLNRHPGWENNSWGYHGDDGNSFCCSGTGTPYGPTFTTNDTIGCGINFRNGTAFYTKNGINLGTAFRDLKGTLFPCIGLRTPGEVIEANFGQRPFVFDINHYMKEEKARLWSTINETPISIPGLSGDKADHSNSVINLLITSYLVHHGYSATAKSFVKNSMTLDLTSDEQMEVESTTPGLDSVITGRVKEELGADREEDIVNRQEIRDCVLSGDIETAIQKTERFYPRVFNDNPEILFQLRCRRFIEMIRCIETQSCKVTSPTSPEKRKNSITEDQPITIETALHYGQELQRAYGDSENPDIKTTLMETFSLLAYQEASKSVVSHLLDPVGREPVAVRLNSAILVSQGRPPIPSLELIFRQSCLVTKNLVENSVGDGSFVNVHKDCLL